MILSPSPKMVNAFWRQMFRNVARLPIRHAAVCGICLNLVRHVRTTWRPDRITFTSLCLRRENLGRPLTSRQLITNAADTPTFVACSYRRKKPRMQIAFTLVALSNAGGGLTTIPRHTKLPENRRRIDGNGGLKHVSVDSYHPNGVRPAWSDVHKTGAHFRGSKLARSGDI
jgi:hypothetical protein